MGEGDTIINCPHAFNMTIMSKRIEIPKTDDERELNDLTNNTPIAVKIGRKTYKIGSPRNGVINKITDIVLNEVDDRKVTAKCVAAILLARYWRIRLFWGVLWRWIYYFAEWDEEQMREVVETTKKKVQLEAYLINTMCLTEMRTTVMMMTREEVNRFRQGLHGEQPTP